jgi:hypothetical protein
MNQLELLASRVIVWIADPTPTPSSAYSGDENLITPGVIGFAITAFVAIATVLLMVDMTRRMRRLRYREEIRQKIAAEGTAQEGTAQEGTGEEGGEKPPGA